MQNTWKTSRRFNSHTKDGLTIPLTEMCNVAGYKISSASENSGGKDVFVFFRHRRHFLKRRSAIEDENVDSREKLPKTIVLPREGKVTLALIDDQIRCEEGDTGNLPQTNHSARVFPSGGYDDVGVEKEPGASSRWSGHLRKRLWGILSGSSPMVFTCLRASR